MKDIYSSLPGLPDHLLVPAVDQPDYVERALPGGDADVNAGDRLADAHVRAGRGEAIAAIHAESGRSYTFADLARGSDRLAAGLSAIGLRPGDRVAFQSTNDPVVLIVMIAIWKAGGVVVPVPSYTRPRDLSIFIEDTGARFYFIHDHVAESATVAQVATAAGVERTFMFGHDHSTGDIESWGSLLDGHTGAKAAAEPDGVAIIWHTGGTTGRPKGCYHTHRRFLLAGYSFGEGNGVQPGQVWTATAPIGHALGLIHHTIFSLLHGATAVFIEDFANPAEVLTAIEHYGVTTLTGLMSSWGKMAEHIKRTGDDHSFDLSTLRRCFAMWQTASAAEVFDFWGARGVELLNNFGSTSFANWVLTPPAGEATPRGSLGKPLPGYEAEAVEIVDGRVRILPRGEAGRLAVRGPSGLTYWNLPDLQRRDVVQGWTLCDDLVRFDDAGFAHYLGRSDYMISTGGYKVAPGEVEEVLSRHPAVREIAVVPAPCPIRGEKVAAFVALNSGYAPDEAEDMLVSLARAELPFYKVPRLIRFIKTLPRDSVGKVQTKIIKSWGSRQE
jgi:2-aminobenzoate-CoA ligase